MPSLRATVESLLQDAAQSLGLDPALAVADVSKRPDLCQFQSNIAMRCAKAARRKPQDLAADLAAALQTHPGISADVAGPGFLNITLDDERLAALVGTLAGDDRAGTTEGAEPQKVLIDYGGPNVAKSMHVGHLRSSILGESLKRVARFLGHQVEGDIHLGDWGLPMGLLIVQIRADHPDLPYFQEGHEGPFPADSPVSLEDLERLYPLASARSKEDEAFRAEAGRATAALQAGHPGYRALWEHFMTATRTALEANFASLEVRFELWRGESTVNERLAPMIQRLITAGIVEEDQGAKIIRVAREDDKTEIPPLILEKRDGGALYSTTDLATIEQRAEEGYQHLVYVVDQRQHLHFEQVFRAAGAGGLDQGSAGPLAFDFVGFGTINGPDGKPFKTRAGGVMKLADLIAMAEEAARARLAEGQEERGGEALDPVEQAQVVRAVALAAIKFADLSNQRLTNYVFDLDRFMRFEGRTGPYLLYAAVRIKSILRRAATEAVGPGEILASPMEGAERALLLELGKFPDAVSGCWRGYAPHILCDHAYELSQVFSRFYHDCPVLAAEDSGVRASRLAMVAAVGRQLDLILGLLGIPVPERM